MKKFFKSIKNVYLNRVISLIILETFLISTVNIYPADTKDNNNKKDSKEIIKNVVDNIRDSIKKDEDEKATLKVSYYFDVEKDVLYITWNRSLESGKKYYVFKKEKNGIRYKLNSTKDGINENFYVTTLADNVGASFVVCESPELPKIPNDVKIYSPYDMGDYVGLFKELKGSVYTESNIIEIKLDKTLDIESKKKIAMIDEKKEEKKEEEKKEEAKSVKQVQIKPEEKKLIDEKMEEKLAKVSEEVKRACNSAVKGNDLSTPPGFFWTDDMHIEYKGIKLDIPKNSAPPKSFVYIKTLDESEKINNSSDSINNTYGDGKGKITGYDVTLFTLRIKDKEVKETTKTTETKETEGNSEEIEVEVIDSKDLKDKKTTIEEYLKQYITYKVGYEEGKEYYWEASNKFINEIDVSIKYNGNTPSYIKKDNAFVYYFDLTSTSWVSLTRASVDTKSNWVTSKTNHFCQFYSGTMNIQNEPPQAKGINTNPINIQAVDPLAGITAIAPPTPNNQGTANVSYPVSVPEGINGLTPKVSINYSSDAKEGDCGFGWNLGISKIERDTKKGVPKYNDTDRLYLDGAEIVPIGNNVYRFKVEGSFSKIVKDKDGFVVFQTDGTKMYYGQYNNSKVNSGTNEFRWMLSRIVDKFGNEMNYYYKIDGGNKYLEKITYGYEDVYSVNFTWEGRSDDRESYMSRFLIRSDLRLKNIIIKYKENELKRYELTYGSTGTSTVRKSVLNNVKEMVKGAIINDNSFTYLPWGDGWSKGESKGSSNGIPNFFTDNNGVTKIELYPVISPSDYSEHQDYWNAIGEYRKIRNYNFDLNADGKNEVLEVTEGYDSTIYGVNPLYDLDLYGRSAYKADPILENPELGTGYTGRYNLTIMNLVDINGDGIPEGPHFTYEYPDLNMDGLVDQILGGRYAINNGNARIKDTEVIDQILRVENEDDLFGDRHDLNGSGYRGDLDGDGLPEYIPQEVITVWVPDNTESDGESHNGSVTVDYTIHRYYDLNGDGLRDKINLSGSQTIWGSDEWKTVDISNSGFGGCAVTVNYNQINPYRALLNKITNNKTGVIITLQYDANGAGKHRKNTLTKITTNNKDFLFETNVNYSGYTHDYIEKEFRGFGKVIVTTKDMDKNIDHVTETTYRVSDNSGNDKYGNTKYDPYLKGLVDTQITKINGITVSRKKNQYEKIQIIKDNTSVYFTNLKTSRILLYDDKGKFIGKDETNGDLSTETIFTNGDIDKTNGLIKNSTSIAYNDPHHEYDDVKSITNNFIDDDKWLCLPVNSETFDKDDKKISGKTIEYYDNGSVKKDTAWNNQANGASPVTEYGYDGFGNVNEIKSYTDKYSTPLTTKTETIYIADSNNYSQVTATSPDGLKTTTKFDIYGRGLVTIDFYGDTSTMTLDEYGRVISIKEIVNDTPTITKMFTYGKEGDYFKVEAGYLDNAGGDNYIKMQFYKDGFGRNVQTKKESMVNGNKCWVVSGYLVRDKMGRAIEQGVPTITTYDKTGYVDNKEESLKIKTTFEYDDFGRFYKAVMANKYWVTKEYDIKPESYKDGNRIVSLGILRDIDNRESIEYKDMQGAVVRTEVKKNYTDNNEKVITTTFEYDLHGYGKVIESTGAVGEKQFNSLGALIWMKSPDAGKFEYVYNDRLLVITVKDYGKTDDGVTRVVNFKYDDLNRMKEINYSDFGNNNIQYEYYDNTGEDNRYARSCIKRITKGDYFEVEYKYDQLSIEVKKRIEDSYYNTKFTYDVQGRIDNVIYPDGEKITYAYDEGGYLKSIIGAQEYISTIKYNEYGQRTYLKYGNGVETNYTYTKETGLLDKMKQFKGINELLSYDYDFDHTGNLTALIDNPNNNGTARSIQNYSYDPMGRISKADGTYKGGEKSYNEAYTFDSDNRILEKRFTRDNGTETKYRFNYANKDHAITSIDITGSLDKETRAEFNYDDFGNMTKKTLKKDTGTSITEFKYDETNKLTEIMLPNDNKRLQFKYDNGGQRITKEFKDGCGTLSKNIYVNGFYELVNDAVNKHISDGQYIFATKLDNKDENILYYSQNNIGSTTLLTNKDGSDVGEFLYTPFGEMWVEEASTVDISNITRFFTNQQYDKESGLYYYNARYYDPHLGSFITPDPAMDGVNHYAYCEANPIRYTDPTGLECDGDPEGDKEKEEKSKTNNDTNSSNNSSDDYWAKQNEKVKEFNKWVAENNLRSSLNSLADYLGGWNSNRFQNYLAKLAPDGLYAPPIKDGKEPYVMSPLLSQKENWDNYKLNCMLWSIVNEVFDTGTLIKGEYSRNEVMNKLQDAARYNSQKVQEVLNEILYDKNVTLKSLKSNEIQELIKDKNFITNSNRLVVQFYQSTYWNNAKLEGNHWVGFRGVSGNNVISYDSWNSTIYNNRGTINDILKGVQIIITNKY